MSNTENKPMFEPPGAGVVSCDQWWMEVGSVDLDGEVVTIQKGNDLLAALSPRDDGRLRVAVFHPLDSKSIDYLTELSRVPHPEHGVCMRANNWEYALDCSAGSGNAYAADRGEAYLSYWQHGVGISWDGSELPDWRMHKDLPPRLASEVVAELMSYSKLDSDAGPIAFSPVDQTETASSAFSGQASAPALQRTAQESFHGCLLGGAVGDALGASVEFMSHREILKRFGPEGISEYAPVYGGLGKITDDTQMTLFTAEGLLRAWVRQCLKGITTYSGVTAHAYLRWLQTQGEQPRNDIMFGNEEPGWLFQQKELHSRRAPGNTCLAALRSMPALGDPAKNDSKGCGGVMRVAPVGLFGWSLGMQEKPDEVFKLGTELAALTHGHPTGALTGGVLAVLVLSLVEGASLPDALTKAKGLLLREAQHQETLRAIEAAEALALSYQGDTGLSHAEAIAQLGQGWIAEEALAISIYCALVARDFRQGVILAVNHDGDSDSTGSITGNILGALHGVQAIPEVWLEPLELRHVIAEMADDLYAFKSWDVEDDRVWEKYPGY